MAVRQQTRGRVLVVTIDNPGIKNAFDRATIEALRELFDGIAYRDPLPPDLSPGTPVEGEIGAKGPYRPHAVVLRSTGDVFCAGAHLGEMKQLGEADYQENLAAAMDMGAMFRAVRNCPAPVIGRVQGPAFGGGVGLVASCDIVVAGPLAKFAFTEVKLGIVPGVIAPLVIDRIGQTAARRYFLTAARFDAVEAKRIGLVDRLAGPDEGQRGLDALVSQTVECVLQGGPAALGLCKSLLEGVQSLGYNRSAELTARMIAQARTETEGQAALAAFAERKPSPWVGTDAWSLPDEPPADR